MTGRLSSCYTFIFKGMESIINSQGIKVEVGKWYYFYNLMSGAPTEARQVTELIRDTNGGCTTCRTRGTFEWDTPIKWVNWIMKEL